MCLSQTARAAVLKLLLRLTLTQRARELLEAALLLVSVEAGPQLLTPRVRVALEMTIQQRPLPSLCLLLLGTGWILYTEPA